MFFSSDVFVAVAAVISAKAPKCNCNNFSIIPSRTRWKDGWCHYFWTFEVCAVIQREFMSWANDDGLGHDSFESEKEPNC